MPWNNHLWQWPAFVVAIMVLLALDLGVFHKSARPVRFQEALGWSLFWCAAAAAFAAFVAHSRGQQDGLEFLTGYVMELSLSLDNVFAIAAIFTYFAIAPEQQHRVLFWGVLGATVMRALLIGLGAELIEKFHWLLMALGAFLFLTGLKWVFSKQEAVEPEKNRVLRFARRLLPVSSTSEGQKLFTRPDGKWALTPLALVLLVVEATDLIFAFDSIPAVFAVTQKPFIVFSSNMFAVMGMRSLYFLLVPAIRYFRFLRLGIAFVLIVIGAKMVTAKWFPVSTGVSLGLIAVIIGGSIVASLLAPERER